MFVLVSGGGVSLGGSLVLNHEESCLLSALQPLAY